MLAVTLVGILLMYCMFGLFGYLRYPNQTYTFLSNVDYSSPTVRSGMIFITISLVCDIPVLIYPTVDVCFRSLFRRNYRQAPLWQRTIGVCSMSYSVAIYSAAVIAAVESDFFVIIVGTLGAVSSVYISVVLPCALYLKRGKTTRPWLKHVCWALLVVTGLGCVCGVVELFTID